MAANDKQVLNVILDERFKGQTELTTKQSFFEYFCAEQILKDFDLSHEDINSGIVDGEHNGGIDAIYAFVNGEVIYEDFDPSPFKKDVNIELHLIQAKTADGFTEVVLEKFISLTRNLLQLDADYHKITQYNQAVKASFDAFRTAYLALSTKFPSLKIFYHYAALKADQHIHANLQKKADELAAVAALCFAEAQVETNFLAAPRLVEPARRRHKTTFQLKTNKVISAGKGYIILSTLAEFNRFLRDDKGKVNRELFESNVRDFQGLTEVNDEIRLTLQSEKVVDFWEMNNGVTILSSRATLNGETVVIESPQIVNGLQTSSQIASYFDEPLQDDTRQLMIKVIASDNEETRDKIIKATNSQNPVQAATLRATDKVQRDIEESLRSAGLYYDRRKNYYKNEGKPADKIISIPLMAQSVMSIILAEPNNARARPSSLLKDDTTYKELFSDALPVNLYVNAALLLIRIDQVLRSFSALGARDKTNIRFYVIYWVAAIICKSTQPKASFVASMDLEMATTVMITEAILSVHKLYNEAGATDQVAKGSAFRQVVQAAVATKLNVGSLLA